MSSLRRVAVALLVGTAFVLTSDVALPKGNDLWLSQKAFKNQKRSRSDRPGYFRRFDNFDNFWSFERQYNNSRSQSYDDFDPEPDYSIIEGKRKAPDEGPLVYEPEKLVPLTDPFLVAGAPSSALGAALLQALREPAGSAQVTPSQRSAVLAFYRQNGFAPLWVTEEGLNERATRTLDLMSRAEEDGLEERDYRPADVDAFADDPAALAGNVMALSRLELSMTAKVVHYAQDIHSGRVVPNKHSSYYDLTPPSLDVGAFLTGLAAAAQPASTLAGLAPSIPAYAAMKTALAELRAKLKSERKEQLAPGAKVKVGQSDARVPMVRDRLIELGLMKAAVVVEKASDDEPEASDPTILDRKTAAALKELQLRRNIRQTGQINDPTIEALNSDSIESQIDKLVLNMERARWLPRSFGPRYVFVNQAAFELKVVEDDATRWQTKVVVGKPDSQTPVFNDEMETVVLNPYWGVPKSILYYEMLPYLASDPYYLDRKGFEVINSRGRKVSSGSVNWWSYGQNIPYDVRQKPGKTNALGSIKFLFPNSHDIYMHDTPAKSLFAKSVRAFSHGCVRVENPQEFATYVMGWDKDRVAAAIGKGENREISLPAHIPVYLNYFTAWPDDGGRVVYYDDVYGRDKRLTDALNSVSSLTVAENN